MLTPIFIDLEKDNPSPNINLYKEDPVDLTIEELDEELSIEPYILAPRYYIKIFSPPNNPSAFNQTIHIQKKGHLSNQIRLSLAPSVNYGVNACYKVEYWEWTPLVNKPSNSITKTLLLTEHWYVPTIHPHSWVASYPFDINNYYPQDLIYLLPFNKPRLITEQVRVNRLNNADGTITDTIQDRNYSHIFSFEDDYYTDYLEDISTISYPFNKQTSKWNWDKQLNGSSITRLSTDVNGNPATGETETSIRYIKPLTVSEIRILPDYLNIELAHRHFRHYNIPTF